MSDTDINTTRLFLLQHFGAHTKKFNIVATKHVSGVENPTNAFAAGAVLPVALAELTALPHCP